ncbi:MAG: orotidine-5'-phosphate decarboxylase [Opitutales bacterium]|nr:orotidine-5'-phosphate decarboxylase [Opitutales bacterium]
MSKQCKLILALDLPDRELALTMLKKLQGSLEWVKIGLQMYLKYGAGLVEEAAAMGFKVFLDLKMYDIPNTVASAVKSLAGQKISMLTIHASGGAEMMSRAAEAAAESNPNLEILAVTVLTSFDEQALRLTGVAAKPAEQVLNLALLAKQSGVRGLVCSPLEIGLLRKNLGGEIDLITPGIRPLGADVGDQKRIMPPLMAARAGSSYIVVGRPILKAADPALAARGIIAELESAK